MYWITGILGILLIIAPFVFNYTSDPAALWSNIILGALVVIVSAIKGFIPDRTRWEYWLAALLGLLAILAPFVLNFTFAYAALWSSIILGVVTAVLAGYKALTMNQSNQQQQTQ
jgi:hypothetical protein